MLFRTLQNWYDLFSYGDGRAAEEKQLREQDWQAWNDRRMARRNGVELPRDEFTVQSPSRNFYETSDGYRAAQLVEQQRHEDGRSKRYPRNLTEAHQQAEDAEHEGQQEDWRIAFEDFDSETVGSRIDRLREDLKVLFEGWESSKQEVKEAPEKELKAETETDWEEINKAPARGWAISSGGEPYRQMASLREPIVPVEIPIEDEDTPALEVDWEAVNQAAKEVETAEQAERNQRLAEAVGKHEVAEFWQILAEEYQLAESEDNDEDEWERENAA